ncbi:MAG: hypothetical protein AAFZ65_17160 [Planctomycetota bacterium]
MLDLVCLTSLVALTAPLQTDSDAAPALPEPADALAIEEPIDPRTLDGELVDGAIAIAGEQIVTYRDWQLGFESLLQRYPVNTQEDVDRLQQEAIRNLILDELAAQAGAELGIPREAIASQADSIESERIDEAGLQQYGDSLRRQGIDPLVAKRQTEGQIYRYQWEAFVTGNPRYGGGRPAVDAFIRPGELRAFYVVRLDDLGKPSEVTLQVIDIRADQAGGQEFAVAALEDVRQQLLNGGSWNDLAAAYSMEHGRQFGIREKQSLAKIADDELRRFAAEAEVGGMSEILEWRDLDGALVGVQIARLLDKTEGEPPPAFDNPILQNNLRGYLKQAQETALIELSRDRLLANAYTWFIATGRYGVDRPTGNP